MKVFVTSDNHFNHKNIIRYCRRPFSSVYEMNETMIHRWNNVVDGKDVVLHLGDFVFRGNCKYFVERLNGIIILIPGNHDFRHLYRLKKQGILVLSNSIVKVDTLIFSHRPLRFVPYGKINIHGHIHERKSWGKRINVSVDVTNFTPISLDYLLSK